MDDFGSHLHIGFLKGEYTLYEVLGHFMHAHKALPEWAIEAIEQGFNDRIECKRTLDEVFGLPTKEKQVNTVRKLKYAPIIYSIVKQRSENGVSIDRNLFDEIAKDLKPTFESEWPGIKPPKASTLESWYQAENKKREN